MTTKNDTPCPSVIYLCTCTICVRWGECMEIHRLLLKVTEPCLFVLGVHDRIKCASAFHVAVSPVRIPFSALRV